jgi:hypothetical protein
LVPPLARSRERASQHYRQARAAHPFPLQPASARSPVARVASSPICFLRSDGLACKVPAPYRVSARFRPWPDHHRDHLLDLVLRRLPPAACGSLPSGRRCRRCFGQRPLFHKDRAEVTSVNHARRPRLRTADQWCGSPRCLNSSSAKSRRAPGGRATAGPDSGGLSRKSGRPDSNWGPPAPKAGALPLRHAPTEAAGARQSTTFTAPRCCTGVLWSWRLRGGDGRGARAEAGAGAGGPAEPRVQERPRVRAHRIQSWVDRPPGRRAPKPQARPSNYRPRGDRLHGDGTTARAGDRRCGGRSEAPWPRPHRAPMGSSTPPIYAATTSCRTPPRRDSSRVRAIRWSVRGFP